MEMIIQVDGKPLKLKSTAAFLLKYKEQFRTDPIKEILGMTKDKQVDITKFDVSIIYQIVWALAKNADPSTPEPITFFDQFESFPIMEDDFIEKIFDMVLESMGASVKPKKP